MGLCLNIRRNHLVCLRNVSECKDRLFIACFSQLESGGGPILLSLQKHVMYLDKERSNRSRVLAHGHEDILQILFDCVLYWQSPMHILSTRLHGVVIAK